MVSPHLAAAAHNASVQAAQQRQMPSEVRQKYFEKLIGSRVDSDFRLRMGDNVHVKVNDGKVVSVSCPELEQRLGKEKCEELEKKAKKAAEAAKERAQDMGRFLNDSELKTAAIKQYTADAFPAVLTQQDDASLMTLYNELKIKGPHADPGLVGITAERKGLLIPTDELTRQELKNETDYLRSERAKPPIDEQF